QPDIEPLLPISEYSGEKGLPSDTENKSSQHAVIEVAARQLFLQFLTNSSSVDDAEFVHMWNLLDILNILGDQGTRTIVNDLLCHVNNVARAMRPFPRMVHD